MLDKLSLHTEYSGFEFNKVYKNTKLYKFLNNDLKHYDFEYKLGLNIDTEQFNPMNKCSKGGLYFCEESDNYMHCTSYGSKLALIEIPNDARVYIEDHKFKADRLIIKKIIDFKNIDDKFWIDIVPKNGWALKYVKKQNEEICILAVQQNGRILEHVKEQTDKICESAVKQTSSAFLFVKNHTDEICKITVQHDDATIVYPTNKQTPYICVNYALRWYNVKVCKETNK